MFFFNSRTSIFNDTNYAILRHYYCLLTVFLIRVIVLRLCSGVKVNLRYKRQLAYVIA